MRGFFDYVRAAFHARPIGMIVPPAWIGIGAFALLGLLNPGFWLLGAGLEMGYLYVLATNRRFQHLINAQDLLAAQRRWQDRVTQLVRQLDPQDQEDYLTLERRCQVILAQQQRVAHESGSTDAQNQGLGRLLWIYLRLLLTRQAISRVLRDSEVFRKGAEPASLPRRAEELQAQLKDESVNGQPELKKSLQSQLEIIQQRIAGQEEARQKRSFTEAELTRIREQIELIREQAALTTSPEVVSQRIDQVAATLGGTTQWIREQQQMYGQVEDLLTEPVGVRPAQTDGGRGFQPVAARQSAEEQSQ